MLIIVWFFDDLQGWAMMVAITGITEKKLHNPHKQVMVFFLQYIFYKKAFYCLLLKVVVDQNKLLPVLLFGEE